MLGRPELGQLIDHLDPFGEREKAMAESRRDPGIAMLVARQTEAGPFAERRRALAQIDRDVEQLACQHADELALWPTQLIVQPADGVSRGARAVLLHECGLDAGRFVEDALVVALIGEPSRVLMNLRLEEHHLAQFRRNDLQR